MGFVLHLGIADSELKSTSPHYDKEKHAELTISSGGSEKENSMDIAIPFANNTLQKWGKPVVTRSMSLYLTRFYT